MLDIYHAERSELSGLQTDLQQQYEAIKAKSLNLDLTRGKPSADQLTLANGLDGILGGEYTTPSGIDTRNYGGLEGIPEARAIGAELLGIPAENVLAGGNSSLTIMHQAMMTAYHFGFAGPESAWKLGGRVKFLCPVPGYDRHYSVCEQLGIEMVNVPMTSNGPDMDVVEELVSQDSTIKGIWCVPKYSNPTGVVYSDDVVDRIAALANKASKHFRVFWDNAYAVHDLSDDPQVLANIFTACEKHGTQDAVIQFASTSKITHAGGGVAFFGGSDLNINGLKKVLSILTIGPDKVNQLRHAKFFEQEGGIKVHMKKHAEIIKPRFAAVLSHLEAAFGESKLGSWESADGGYFISFDTLPGLAKRVVALAAGAGVKLTPAGATYPYGKDPEDKNIRIAPTVPTVEQVNAAMEVFVLCVQLASVEWALEKQ